MPTKINPREIKGAWLKGVALDLHTLKSELLGTDEHGHKQFNTTYSEIGGLLHRLKYRGDLSVAPAIIEAATGFLTPYREKFDLIVPVPPSSYRPVQPVQHLAAGIGATLGVALSDCIKTTRPPAQLKGVDDPDKRKELLNGLYTVDPASTAGRNVLLFDDLYRSGSTMNEITGVLYGVGQASSVRVLTITCTRTNR